MSDQLIIHYRGYEIRWNDNLEEWSCDDLSGKLRSSDKPSKLKAAIDKMYLDRRKAAAVAVLEVTYGGHSRGELIDAKVTEYLGSRRDSRYVKGKSEYYDRHKVAVSALRGSNDKISRQEKELTDLAMDTPEVREAYARYSDLYNQAKELDRQANAAREAIPRLTIEDIKPLVELYEKMQAEGA